VSLLETVSFQHITRILGVIDDMEISREAVEIPLSPESPGVVRRLSNGKLEIVVDAEMPFDDWLQTLPQKIQGVMPEDMESDS
jgi:methionine synthase II (cobalamin-independent)